VSIVFRIEVRCDRCSEVHLYESDRKEDLPLQHNLLPADWERGSDNWYNNIDLCEKCAKALHTFMEYKK
jgi:hypothetical protein